jgi:hypothetical protein
LTDPERLPRLFSLDEALAILPRVRQLLLDIQQSKREVERLSAELEQLLARSSGNGHLAADVASTRSSLQREGAHLESLIAEVEATGAELKGIDEGLIDFRSEREGRTVYLCWRQGEDTISHWHELDTGFAGRQPL